MTRNVAAVVFALSLAALVPASAQTPAPQSPPPSTAASAEPQTDAPPSSRAQRDGSEDADARHCLDLATNNEIIACAEKYRSHRTRK